MLHLIFYAHALCSDCYQLSATFIILPQMSYTLDDLLEWVLYSSLDKESLQGCSPGFLLSNCISPSSLVSQPTWFWFLAPLILSNNTENLKPSWWDFVLQRTYRPYACYYVQKVINKANLVFQCNERLNENRTLPSVYEIGGIMGPNSDNLKDFYNCSKYFVISSEFKEDLSVYFHFFYLTYHV